MQAATRTLLPDQGSIELVYDTNMKGWFERSFSNVLAFAPGVSGFGVSGAAAREVAAGNTLDTAPSFTVSYVGTPTAASIDIAGFDGSGNPDPCKVNSGDYPITLSAPFTSATGPAFDKGSTVGATRTFTVTATVGGGSSTDSATITYYNSRYAGSIAQNTALNGVQVTSLSSAISNDNLGTFLTVTASSGNYVWYCYRAALGPLPSDSNGYPCISINGERAAFNRIGSGNNSVTNASGFTENFEEYCSALPGLGFCICTAAGTVAPNRVYLLKSTATTAAALTDAEINAATASNLQNSIAYNPSSRPNTGDGEYIWYLFPNRLTFATIAFYVNSQVEGGMDGAGTTGQTLTHVNRYGYSELYRAFRSDNAKLGPISSWSCSTT